jgi:general secretion pathway protein D
MKQIAKILSVAALLVFSIAAKAEEKMKMNYSNEEITKIIEAYAKASGQKFIVDSTVRGKITIFNPTEVPLEEAYNQLSSALALNGFAIVQRGSVSVVRNARSAQRDSLQVYTNEVPPAQPDRMVTWIVTLKNVQAGEINRAVRMLTSSYGEMAALEKKNQLIFTDWSSNIQRISETIKRLDVPTDPAAMKIIEQDKKERMTRNKDQRESKDGKDSKPHMAPPAPPTED